MKNFYQKRHQDSLLKSPKKNYFREFNNVSDYVKSKK